MFEDPNAPPGSDPTGGGSGSGGGAKSIDAESSIQGYKVPEDTDTSTETTDTPKLMPDSDPTGGGSGSGGG
jgi:hypothetical protein